NNTAGSALRRGRGLRTETTAWCVLDLGAAIALNRGPRIALRRSARSTQKSAAPRKIVEPRAAMKICSRNSGGSDIECCQQAAAVPVACGAVNKIRPQPGRQELAVDGAVVPLAAIMKGEQ